MAVTKLQIVTSTETGESSPQPLLQPMWTRDGWSFNVANYLREFVPGQIYATLTDENIPHPPFTVDLTGHGLKFCGRQCVQIRSTYVFCRMDDNQDYILSLPKAGTLYLPVMKLETIFHYLYRVRETYITHWTGGREGHLLEFAAQQLVRAIYQMRYPDADLFAVLSSRARSPYRTIGPGLSRGNVVYWDVIPGTPDLCVDIWFSECSEPERHILQSLAQCQDLGLIFL